MKHNKRTLSEMFRLFSAFNIHKILSYNLHLKILANMNKMERTKFTNEQSKKQISKQICSCFKTILKYE